MAESTVLNAIDAYVQAESTGTAMIVFSDNSLGRIYLNAGTPISARYKNMEGMEALQGCKSLGVKTVKFHPDTDIVRSSKLLRSNYEVLASLNADNDPVSKPEPEDNQGSPDDDIDPGNLLTSQGREQLGDLLADYIGPVAPLVMSDLPRRIDIESALSIVSREIDDTRRASDFVNAARQIL